MLYIFWGEDDFSIEESLQKIKNEFSDSSLGSMNMTIADGQKIELNELRAVGAAAPFLAEKRLLIVKGLLQRFEPKGKSTLPVKSGSESKKNEYKEFAACIKSFPESTILILTDTFEGKGGTLKNNPLFNLLNPVATTKYFPPIKGIKLSQWIQNRVNSYGGSISHQATNLLKELVDGNLYVSDNEIQKLVAFSGGRMIEEKDIRMVVSAAQEIDIFMMVDAIMKGEISLAQMTFQELILRGVVPAQMLVLLARQFQTLVMIKDMRNNKIPFSDIRIKLGLSSDFVWGKILKRSENYALENLKGIYGKLLETDLSIKTGRMEGVLALNLLIAELCYSSPKPSNILGGLI